MPEPVTCYECEGSGADSGALNEPEVCQVCHGAGVLHVELDTRSSHYGQRKPIARATRPEVTGSRFRRGRLFARGAVRDQLDRERALLVCADRGKLIHTEPQDVVALLDFMDSDKGSEPTSTGHPKTGTPPTDEAKL